MREYYIDHPSKDGYEILISNDIVKNIIIDYMRTTFYWVVGLSCGIIGFLLGVIAK